jgi:hypothetical protein
VALTPGQHQVVIVNNTTACTDTFNVLVSCPDNAVVDTTIQIGNTITICLDTTLIGSNLIINNNCPNASNNISYTVANNCIEITGAALGTDTLCFVATNPAGQQIALTIFAHVVPGIDTQFISLPVGATTLQCLTPLGIGSTVTNICPLSSGNSAAVTTFPGSLCVSIAATSLGTDTACLIVCAPSGICDTTILIITSLPKVTTTDTVLQVITIGNTATY